MIVSLPARAVLAVTGEDRVAFLQGLVSNDVALAEPGRWVWAALLTPQGKWLADFFIGVDGERLLLDVEAAQAAMLVQRLQRYRLRARVAVEPTGLGVVAGWGEAMPEGAGADPRAAEAGWRLVTAEPSSGVAGVAAWDRMRLGLGLPDGSRDMEAEKTTLLEANFDALHGVSWSKGCYMGQELTARTKYRGLLKRRMVPVRVEGALPPVGTATADGGSMRSGVAGFGLALLRVESIAAGVGVACGGAVLVPQPPAWMVEETATPASAEG